MTNAIKWWWGLLLAFGLIALARPFVPLPFIIEVLIFSIYTMGCNFLLGRVGFISFGQPAYLAAGAYGTAFYLFYFGTNPYLGILVGIASGLAVAAIVGPLFVRLRSDYFALVNLALTVIIYYLMQKVLAGVTKGDNGLWFLTRMTSTPLLDIATPKGFFIFAFLKRICESDEGPRRRALVPDRCGRGAGNLIDDVRAGLQANHEGLIRWSIAAPGRQHEST